MNGLTYEQYTKLFEINRLITQSLDVKEVLRNLVNAAIDLLGGYDYYDAGTPIRFRAGEAITGRVFQERIIRNIPRDQAAEYMKYVGWKFISF